ncbi:Uncharacterised protein [Mycolicibacterium vanbaalenii]|uniref:Uncharacterized protein n=1 Tax=Mycolicibacterium vanbaalenii TaxID=110539 RepID=A0A5S9R5R6_MYCVN|nr:hypothetical protein [Mycolicibacterium vanbaalenii]CAA0129300.1 Uncharacterised protein [Mycolicibacterium vanbaalenii]
MSHHVTVPQFFLKTIRVYRRVEVDADTHWLPAGHWYRRRDLTRLTGWRLVRHRILWGFTGLIDAR